MRSDSFSQKMEIEGGLFGCILGFRKNRTKEGLGILINILLGFVLFTWNLNKTIIRSVLMNISKATIKISQKQASWTSAYKDRYLSHWHKKEDNSWIRFFKSERVS